MVRLFLASFLLLSCSASPKNELYSTLKEYEGLYETYGESTLTLQASKLDTTLYAIIDNAKYPLQFDSTDHFKNNQGDIVTFQRDINSNIQSYSVDGNSFQLLSSEFQKFEMEPRSDINNNPSEYSYQVPAILDDGLSSGSFYDEFQKPELILEMVEKTISGEYRDVHSILIYKNDKLVLDEYFYGYDYSTPHQLRSATKVFYGTLLGIAIHKGLIKNEDQLLLPYFSGEYESFDNLDSRKKNITIKDFLTYQHGMDCQNNNPESQGNEMAMMQSNDWVKFTLDLPMVSEPGTTSNYCTGVALTLGRLIEIVSGTDLETFAKENLFNKLGIQNYEWQFAPDSSSRENFSQKYLTPRELLNWAILYQNGGKWNGEQIISSDWVDKSFSNYGDGEFGYLWEHKYIYVNGKRFDSYMASGNGGQKINIWPELDMITVFTGGNYNSYLLYGVSTPPNRMIPNYILKATKQ
jgi:CubicO group peptidase (beta-lactamase class C family)